MVNLSLIKKYLRFGSNCAMAVDFNNDSLKILQMERKGKVSSIVGWNRKKMPKDVVEAYEIKDEKKFQETFLATLKETDGKIKGRDVIVCLPENKVFTRIITMPAMKPEEAAEAIKWETESNIPIAIEEVYFDWQIVETSKDTMKVLIMACPKKLIDNYLQAFDNIGYNVVACEAESIATGRSVLKEGEDASTLIVDLGSDSTSYSIYHSGYPVFTSSGSISGKLITDTIGKKLNLDDEKSESYKIKVGLGENKYEKEESFLILAPLLASLVAELEKTISFYDDKINLGRKESLQKIMICGGGSNLKGLASYLAIHLQRDVIQSNPWVNINLGNNTPPISKELSQGYATVIGLAMRGQNYEDYA